MIPSGKEFDSAAATVGTKCGLKWGVHEDGAPSLGLALALAGMKFLALLHQGEMPSPSLQPDLPMPGPP